MTQEQNQSEIDWAYKVLESFKESFDRAIGKPDLTDNTLRELVQKFSIFLESILVLVEKEHKMEVYQLVKSYAGMIKTWAKSKT